MPEQSGIISITNFAPRFGAVWDLRGDHKTTIKGSAGRFYDALAGSDIDAVTPAALGFRLYDWADRNGDRVYQVGEEGVLRSDTRRSLDPARLPFVDEDLKNQYVDVYTIGIEHQIVADWAFTATGIFKRDGDFKGVVNSAVPFSSYNLITVTNPLDGQPLQIYTLRPQFLGVPGRNELTNPGERPGDTEPLVRKYNGLELVLRRQMRNRWMFQGRTSLATARETSPTTSAAAATSTTRIPTVSSTATATSSSVRATSSSCSARGRGRGTPSSAATSNTCPGTRSPTTSAASASISSAHRWSGSSRAISRRS